MLVVKFLKYLIKICFHQHNLKLSFLLLEVFNNYSFNKNTNTTILFTIERCFYLKRFTYDEV